MNNNFDHDHQIEEAMSKTHGLKSQNRYRFRLMVFSVSMGNIGHIGNIGPDIGRYYRVNMVSCLKVWYDIADTYWNRL